MDDGVVELGLLLFPQGAARHFDLAEALVVVDVDAIRRLAHIPVLAGGNDHAHVSRPLPLAGPIARSPIQRPADAAFAVVRLAPGAVYESPASSAALAELLDRLLRRHPCHQVVAHEIPVRVLNDRGWRAIVELQEGVAIGRSWSGRHPFADGRAHTLQLPGAN